jgi:hypothetical protein
MLRLYIPVAVTVALIASLTMWEAKYSDRWNDSSVDAAEFGKRFAQVPMEIDAWIGEDNEVGDETLDVAGAVNHISRTYVNAETEERVDLWLVVGHSRDIGRHTPDVCYPSQGFAQDGDVIRQKLEPANDPPAEFFTARFRSEGAGGMSQRVFWAWNENVEGSRWEAPANVRTRFGNNTALYKMYFTASMPDKNQPVGENTAYRFAEMMLPIVNKALFPERYPADKPAATATPAEAAPAAAGEGTDAEPAAEEPAAAPAE